jgi:hypothetical protein
MDERRFKESVEISGYRRELSRRELGMRRRILEILRDGPKTVPETAEALGLTSHETMWWMMGFVSYGYVAPSERAGDDGYYRYRLVEREE